AERPNDILTRVVLTIVRRRSVRASNQLEYIAFGLSRPVHQVYSDIGNWFSRFCVGNNKHHLQISAYQCVKRLAVGDKAEQKCYASYNQANDHDQAQVHRCSWALRRTAQAAILRAEPLSSVMLLHLAGTPCFIFPISASFCK